MTVTESDIATLVEDFYRRARADETLGPVFEAVVSDWDLHHRRVADFWSHVLLGTDRYHDHPFRFHVDLPIEPDDFRKWMQHLTASATAILPAEAAMTVITRAAHMTRGFTIGMFPYQDAEGRPTRTLPPQRSS
ncbi:MAG: group III truncated hemoglobin [Telmatospirillum sp.]|nr:group III truncated hemoglobin [Telmatospirillum sp.]